MDVVVAAVAVEVVEEINMANQIPNHITFQWHITDICDLRCKHCYQSDYTNNGLIIDDLFLVLDKISSFIKFLKEKNHNLTSQINITGGEPFLRDDIIELISKIKSYNLFQFAILSNGKLMESEKLDQLVKLEPKFIQLSLEGDEKTNDFIRGKGSYKQVKTALKEYKKRKIPVMISFTANAKNYTQFREVVKFARKNGAFKVWTDRYLPIKKDDQLILSKSQTRDFFNNVLRLQKRERIRILRKVKISSNRALQFLVSGGLPYRCSAGTSLLAILPNGDLLPCRRLPIKIGNILTDDLKEIYYKNNSLIQLRDQENLDYKCKGCYYKHSCNGGLKCLSYAIEDDFNIKDPNCWI